MPPGAMSNPTRGRGRPKKDAAPPAPSSVAVAEAPKRRGRVPKVVAPIVSESQSKGRGRAAKAPVETDVDEVAPDNVPTRRGRGRAPKQSAVEEVPPPVQRGGRPRKQVPVVQEASATPPKRRGRPPKNAGDLDRVLGSPRVTKRTPQRTKTAPRVDPRVRSKLRTRLPPAENKAATVEAPKPKKRIGKPARKDVAAVPAKKTIEHKMKGAHVTKPTAKPRKRRGFTMLEVPDKYAKAITDHLQHLIDNDVVAAGPEPSPADLDAQSEAPIEEQDDVIVDESNRVLSDEVNDDMGASEQLLDELEDDMKENTDAGAQELSVSGKEGLMKPIEYEASEEITEEVVISQNVEVDMEVDVEQSFPRPQEVEELAAGPQIQYENTEEVDVEYHARDEPDSLFDDYDEASALAPVNAPVAQMLPATFGPTFN
jgi:hypothetical protein